MCRREAGGLGTNQRSAASAGSNPRLWSDDGELGRHLATDLNFPFADNSSRIAASSVVVSLSAQKLLFETRRLSLHKTPPYFGMAAV